MLVCVAGSLSVWACVHCGYLHVFVHSVLLRTNKSIWYVRNAEVLLSSLTG